MKTMMSYAGTLLPALVLTALALAVDITIGRIFRSSATDWDQEFETTYVNALL